jgi:hypothetical protein
MRSLDTFFVPAGLSDWAVLAFMVVIPYLPDAFQVGKIRLPRCWRIPPGAGRCDRHLQAAAHRLPDLGEILAEFLRSLDRG